jgi:hypothetical protein
MFLISGQSNALEQAAYFPEGSYAVVARGSTSIVAWDWDSPGGDLGRDLLEVLGARSFRAFVWWQGETDGLDGMPAADYADRFSRILRRVNVPTMIVEMADHPSRTHLKTLQATMADSDPLIALIDTSGLAMKGLHDFDSAGRPTITDRVTRCLAAQCWKTPGEFR